MSSWKSSEGERVKREWSIAENKLETARQLTRKYMERIKEREADVERVQSLNNQAYERAWFVKEKQYREQWDNLEIMQHRQKMLSIMQASVYGNSYGGARAGRDIHRMVEADIDRGMYSIADKLEMNYKTQEMELTHQKEQVDIAYKDSIKRLRDEYEMGELKIKEYQRESDRIWRERERILDEIWSTKTRSWGGIIMSVGIGALTGAFAMPALGAAFGAFGATAGIGAAILSTGLTGVAIGAIAGGIYGFKHDLTSVLGFVQQAQSVGDMFAGLGNKLSTFGTKLEKQYGTGEAFNSILQGGVKTFENISNAFKETFSMDELLSPAQKFDKMTRMRQRDNTMLSRGVRVTNQNRGYDVLSGVFSSGEVA